MTTTEENPAALTSELEVLTGEYEIDAANTRLGFTARYAMVADVHGWFGEFSGRISLEGHDLARSRVAMRILTDSLDSGQAQRDAHLRSSDFLDVDTYPEMLFKSTTVEVAGPGLWCVVGELTICAVTRPFSLNLTLIGSATGPDGRALVGFRGTGSLSRTEFGLRWNKVLETGGVLVGDEVDLCLDVTLTKTQPSVTVAPSAPAGSRGRSRWWRRTRGSQA